MIKEKTIKILVVGRTKKKYENLGYKCTVGEKLEININELAINSHEKITAICDKCGRIYDSGKIKWSLINF